MFLAIAGSAGVGSELRESRYLGFIAFMFSNALWIIVAAHLGMWPLLAMNLAFLVTSIRGYLNNG